MKQTTLIQFVKYGAVGVSNTLVTAAVIWLMMALVFQVKDDQEATPTAMAVSNITGYVAGLINSFIWNRKWTFQSQTNWKTDFSKFTVAFLLCYIPQLLLVMALKKYLAIAPLTLHLGAWERDVTQDYLFQLAGLVFYTAINFLCNKYYTFKS
jgi:putative flippase GtrA